MPKVTIRETLVAAIEARGGKLLEQGKKRWKLSHYRLPNNFIYLGPSGSMKTGRTVESSLSFTYSDVYNALVKEGQELVKTGRGDNAKWPLVAMK